MSWALDGIKALGVAGGPVFAVLWWLERAERMACQKETKELVVQVLTVANQATNSVSVVTKAVSELGEGTKDSVTFLAQLIRSMNKVARGK